VEEADLVGVLGRHGLRAHVLDVPNDEVAVVCPSHAGRVHAFHHQSENVLVPVEDEVPEVALVELFGPVEEVPVGLDGDRGHRVLRLEVGDDAGEGTAEGALPVERALQVHILALQLVLSLQGQGRGHLASHRVVSARKVEQPGDLLHAEVALGRHGGPAGRAVGQAGEAVAAYQMPLDALLDGWRDMVQTDWTLQQREQLVRVHGAQLQGRRLLQDTLHHSQPLRSEKSCP